MHARRITAVLVPLAATLALAASAQAGIPFTVGPGANPDVAVSADGTANIVWHAPDAVMFCKVPRGALACAGTPLRLTAPLSPVESSAHVLLAGGSNILVTSTRCCPFEIDVYSSPDNGATFGAPVKIGTPPSDWGDAGVVQGPGATLSAFSLNSYMNLPLTGPPVADQASFSYGAVVGISASGGVFAGTTPVHVFSDGTNLQFVRYNGAGGSLNDSASWTAPAAVGPGDAPSAASGSTGFVVLSRTGAAGAQRLFARKFNGTSFGSPVGVSETGSPDLATLRSAPTNGRFTAIWICNACTGGRELRVSQSADGAIWSAPATILKAPNTDNISAFRPRAAVAGDGEGFAVWDTGTDVRATSLDPPGGPAPAPNTTTTTTVGDQSVGFDSPKGCVHAAHPIVLNVVTKTKKNLVGKQPKTFVQQVVFSVDKKKVTDKKKKFTATFKTNGFVSGSTHSGSALITFKQQGRKKTFTKTIKKSFKIC